MDNFGLLTIAAVAEMLRCSKAHVCNVIAGKVPGCAPIPAISFGRRKLVRRESLEVWIMDNEPATIPTSPERGRKRG